ncbi:MAG: fibronectin type III domain-containing protein [Verrucomicrobiota bacterium]
MITKVRRNWTKLPTKQRLEFAKKVVDGIENNAHVGAPRPSHPEFKAIYEKADASNERVESLRAELKVAMSLRDDDLVALMDALETEASTVESATGGDPSRILTTGYEPADQRPQAPRDLEQVAGLTLETGENPGELDASWERVEGARSYEISMSTDPNQPGGWTHRATVIRSRTTLEELTSGQRIWVRVRAIGSMGAGSWSETAGRIVP